MCGSHQAFCPAIPTGSHSAVVVSLQCASRCVGCRRLRLPPAHRSCCVAGWGLPLFALPGAAAGGTRRSGGGGAGGKRARQRAGSRCASGARSACRFLMHEAGGCRSLLFPARQPPRAVRRRRAQPPRGAGRAAEETRAPRDAAAVTVVDTRRPSSSPVLRQRPVRRARQARRARRRRRTWRPDRAAGRSHRDSAVQRKELARRRRTAVLLRRR